MMNYLWTRLSPTTSFARKTIVVSLLDEHIETILAQKDPPFYVCAALENDALIIKVLDKTCTEVEQIVIREQ